MSDALDSKIDRLRGLLRATGSVVVAFSGGADSALVLAVAHDVLAERAVGAIGVSRSLAADELADARRVAGDLGARLVELPTDEVEDPRYVRNAPDRCYFCKAELHAKLAAWARDHGFAQVVDGLNADDDPADRPGVRAAVERGVRSPLREAGLTKADVREASRRRGLVTADKPAAPCLASRIPHGTPVTVEALAAIESAERALRSMGFAELRVRHHGAVARIEAPPADFDRALEMREAIARAVRDAGFRFAALDLEGLRTGGANRSAVRAGAPESES
jgi:pyridinium-3,5-biscarboxylic acid mononucleotide sulfurtransferase